MKKYSILLLSMICVLLLVSCGKKDEIIGADLAEYLNEGVRFSEPLTEIDDIGAEKYFGLNPGDYSEITAYVGTKAVCDQFVIIKTNQTTSVTKKLNAHLEALRNQYSAYRHDQIYKIDNVFLTDYKGSIVMVVSSDYEQVKRVYKQYLKD